MLAIGATQGNAAATFEGASGGTPGDGQSWLGALNWSLDTLPLTTDDVIFGSGITGPIQLEANQTVNRLTFNTNASLGARGDGNVLTNTTGIVSVGAGAVATINSQISGTAGLSLSGGGTLYLSNLLNSFTGNVTVDGVGSTLLTLGFGQPAAINRSDLFPLGQNARNVTMTNGGTFKVAGNSFNPDSTTKNFVLGAGGGGINIAAGFQHFTLDDASQISATTGSSLTKTGNGALQITSQDYNLDLTGGVFVNGGLLRLSRVQGNVGNSRVSAFTAATPITINSGGRLVVETGTQGILDNNLTLNPGGVLAINGNEHNIGTRSGAASVLTLNGGTILVRDGFNPQSSGRLPRMDAQMVGSGTIDLIGGTANAGNSRLVFQRSDVNSTFSGTFVIHGITALELNTRDNALSVPAAVNAFSGNGIGNNAQIELRGFDATADLRDAGGAILDASNLISSFNVNTNLPHLNNVSITGTEPGGVQRMVVTTGSPLSNGAASGTTAGFVQNSNIAGSTGNVIQMGNLLIGSNRLYVTNGNSYGLRFGGTTTLSSSGLTPVSPIIDLNAGSGIFEINGDIIMNVAGDSLTRQGRNGIVQFSGAIAVDNLTLRANETRLFGANGFIASPLTINSGMNNNSASNSSSGAVLNLNNNFGNIGNSVTAATNGNRLNDSSPITMLGDGTIRLTTQNATTVEETTGDITITGRATFDIVKNGVLGTPAVLTLGSTAPIFNANSAVNFTGTSLGSTGADSTRIVIPGAATSGFMGANVTAGNEWARYDAAAAGGATIGVVGWVNADYGAGLNAVEAAWVSGLNVKLNGATGQTLSGARSIGSLNLQFSAANQSIATAGNLLSVELGGIIVASQTAGITGVNTVGTGLTAGFAATQSPLYITNANQLDINAIVQDNTFGGQVTLVKNGGGLLRLTNQNFGVGAGAGAIGAVIAATHTNTFTGGLVINQGRVEAFRPEYLNGNVITIQGGAFDINQPVAAGTFNALGMATSNGGNNSIVNWGNNMIFNSSGGLLSDDNGEGNDASVGGNVTFRLGTLTTNGTPYIGFGSFGNGQISAAVSSASASDFLFTGATFNGRPTFQTGTFRSAGTVLILGGNVTGSAFNVEATGDTQGVVQLGNGGADNVANTYTGAINLIRTSGNGDVTLRLDKANGVTAVTGDVVINGGLLAWGPGAIQDKASNVNIAGANAVTGANAVSPNNLFANQWTGNSIATAFANTTSGNNQIADNANVTLMFGTLNQSGNFVNEKFGTLRQLNGQFNTGSGTIQVDTYEMSGGTLNYNSGGTFKAGTVNLLSGAQEFTVANNFAGAVSTLEVGAGGMTINGQNLILGNADYFTPSAGAVLKLGGSMSIAGDPLNFTNTDRQKGITSGGGGREHAANAIDFNGGVRTISVTDDIFYTLNIRLRNGGFTKEGDGSLAIQNWMPSDITGPVTVNNGNLLVRGNTALGSAALDVNNGGTLKLDGGWTLANAVTVSGPGADVPRSGGVLELGALVSEAGANRLTGPVTIDSGATIASNLYPIPSSAAQTGPVAGLSPLTRSNLNIENLAGVTGTGDLTLGGGGDGTITFGVNTNGGVTKIGSGIWSLGDGTFTGAVDVQAGILRIKGNNSLGTTGNGTRVRGGATVLLDGSLNTPEAFNIAGRGQDSLHGAIESTGDNQITGAITLAGNATIRTTAGNLSLRNQISGNGTLTLTGAGFGDVRGNITNSATGDALVKNGSGTWTLLGNDSFTGGVRINGGTLQLNSAGNALGSASSVTLAGGSLVNAGPAQVVNGLNVVAGGGNAAGGAGLNVGAITRSPNATVNFSGNVTTSTPNDATGIIGSWATRDYDWATGGGPIGAFSAYTNIGHAIGVTGAGNHGRLGYDINGYAKSVHTVAVGGETLKIAEGLKGWQTGANAITLGAGGLIQAVFGESAPAPFNLGGGLLSGATPNSELNIRNAGPMYISNALIGAGSGSLNKSGAGELRLFGSSAFTGGININGGTLSVVGQVGTPGALGGSLVNANRLITLNGGTFSVASGDYDLNDYDGVTAGVQSMQFLVGPGGGTLHSGNGQLLINDTAQLGGSGQLMGSGDLHIAGGGRVSIDNSFPLFTGDIYVDGGVLKLANGVSLGTALGGLQSTSQKIVMGPRTGLLINADVQQSFDFQGDNQISFAGADRHIRGPVTINGKLDIVLRDRDANQTARSLAFSGPVSGTGTINITGINTNGRVQFAGGYSNFTGTVNIGHNATVDIRSPGGLGTDTAVPTINLEGSRARLRLQHYQNGDFNVNVNANGKFGEIAAIRLDNYGLGTQGIYSINSLTATANNYLTLTGDNSNWVTVNSGLAAAGDLVLVTSSNALLRSGGTVNGLLDKRGPSVLASEGVLNVAGKVLIQQGWIDLRGAGSITGATAIDIRGGNLMLSNNVSQGANANRIAGIPLTLGGGTVRVVGTSNLGTITLAPGSTELNYAMDTQSDVTPLVINDVGATRAIGSQLRVASTFGTIGAPTNLTTNPRIQVTGMADNFGNGLAGNVDIIPWAVFGNVTNGGNEFLAYRSTLDAGQALGLAQVTNGSMRSDPADGTGAGQTRSATAVNEIMRFTGTNVTTTLAGNANWRAIKMDGSTRTVALGGFTLAVDRGAIIHVANTQLIGLSAAGSGTLTVGAGVRELQTTVNSGELQIGAVVADNGVPLNIVKNGPATLRFVGVAPNTFTGNVYLNNGLLVNNAINQVPAGATVFFNGGRWEPNPTAVAATDVLNQGNNLVFNANSTGLAGQPTLSLDNGTGPQDNDIAFGSFSINNGVEVSIAGWDGVDGIFNATAGNPHVMNGTPTLQLFQSRTGAATNEAVMTFNGPISGGYYVQSIGAAAGTNPSNTTLNIGGGAADLLGNTGNVTILGNGAASNFPIVRLNKAPGTNAIGGNLTLNGGSTILLASNQIADGSNLTVNGDATGSSPFALQLNGFSETVNNIEINGGGIATGAGTLTANNITVNGGNTASADNLQINSGGGAVIVNGRLTVNDFGQVTLGANNSTLVVNGGLTMTGGRIQLNGDAAAGTINIVRLNSDVVATSSISQAAQLGNTNNDNETFLELNGSRAFDVADGPQGVDLAVSALIRNSTGAGASAGGILKLGDGVMVLQGGSTANTFTDLTVVAQGTLDLFKGAGVNSIGIGGLQIGGGIGNAAVRVRNNNQIADTANIHITAEGVLDMQSFNTSETIARLSGDNGARVLLGPSSNLTVSITSDATYDGNITGGGATTALTKNGGGTWTLSGFNEFSGDTSVTAGTLSVTGVLSGSTTRVSSGATLAGTGSVSDVFLPTGAFVAPGVGGSGMLSTRDINFTGGTYSLQIGSAISYDQINVTGLVNLTNNSPLSITLGYQPSIGDSFAIVLNNLTDAVNGPGLFSYLGTPLTEGASFTATSGIFSQEFSITYVGGDGNDIVLNAVPEPGSAALLLGGLAMLAGRRRRKS